MSSRFERLRTKHSICGVLRGIRQANGWFFIKTVLKIEKIFYFYKNYESDRQIHDFRYHLYLCFRYSPDAHHGLADGHGAKMIQLHCTNLMVIFL